MVLNRSLSTEVVPDDELPQRVPIGQQFLAGAGRVGVDQVDDHIQSALDVVGETHAITSIGMPGAR